MWASRWAGSTVASALCGMQDLIPSAGLAGVYTICLRQRMASTKGRRGIRLARIEGACVHTNNPDSAIDLPGDTGISTPAPISCAQRISQPLHANPAKPRRPPARTIRKHHDASVLHTITPRSAFCTRCIGVDKTMQCF